MNTRTDMTNTHPKLRPNQEPNPNPNESGRFDLLETEAEERHPFTDVGQQPDDPGRPSKGTATPVHGRTGGD